MSDEYNNNLTLTSAVVVERAVTLASPRAELIALLIETIVLIVVALIGSCFARDRLANRRNGASLLRHSTEQREHEGLPKQHGRQLPDVVAEAGGAARNLGGRDD